jgi:serine protease
MKMATEHICAGTIGAVNNTFGIVGVNRNPNLFQFHIGKALDDEGNGYASTTIEAVQGCVDRGARVVSMSLGSPSKSRTEKQFYEDMWNQGILVIAAAGNDGNSGHMYPASYPHVMSVAAVNVTEEHPDFSQCNSQVEISAPGVDILSTIPNGR